MVHTVVAPYMVHSYGEMENYVVNQLPELDSLPDGFVDSSADPLTPSSPTPDQEDEVPDCKEGKLLKVDSRNDSVGDDSQSCEGDDGSAEQARALTVELSECGSCDEQKLVETPAEDCKDESDVGSPNLVFENVVGKSEQEMAPSTDGNKNAAPSCQNLGKSNEQGVEVQAALAQGTLSSESSGTSRKRAPLETTGIRGSGHFLVVWQNLPNLLPTLSFHQRQLPRSRTNEDSESGMSSIWSIFLLFPNGESAADVYDRITGFRKTLRTDIDIGRFQPPGEQSPNTNLVIVSHGLTLRVFLMRWYKWIVEQFERLNNVGKGNEIVMQTGQGGRYSLLVHHTQQQMIDFGLTQQMLDDQIWQKTAKPGELNYDYLTNGPSFFTHFDDENEAIFN